MQESDIFQLDKSHGAVTNSETLTSRPEHGAFSFDITFYSALRFLSQWGRCIRPFPSETAPLPLHVTETWTSGRSRSLVGRFAQCTGLWVKIRLELEKPFSGTYVIRPFV